MAKMAGVVDGQNASDPTYQPMLVDDQPSGHAFDAAWQLVMNGVTEPSGYTEPGLHHNRGKQKIAKQTKGRQSGAP